MLALSRAGLRSIIWNNDLHNVVVTDAVVTGAVVTDEATVGSMPLGWQELSFEIPLPMVEIWSFNHR